MSEGSPGRPLIELTGVEKVYRDFWGRARVRALHPLSLALREGEIVALLGPNGAGKSTTMKTLVGFLPASRGRATVDGLDVTRYPIETRRRIGYLPEHTPLYGDMRVGEFLAGDAAANADAAEAERLDCLFDLFSCQVRILQ